MDADLDAEGRLLAERGVVVLRAAVDGVALSAEVDAALADAFADVDHVNTGAAGTRFRYVPMMDARTPVSLGTTVRLAAVAARLLGGQVLPGRTKATCYLTGTGWHRDSHNALRSIGILCYLDPLTADDGALHVVPGSHRAAPAAGSTAEAAADAVALPTIAGDAIVLDERVLHSSSGGDRWRRQWRVDFVEDPGPAADDELREYYAGAHTPDWDGGYDAARYPSYGVAWRQLDARWTERLDRLGAFAAAAAEEDATARARAPRPH